MGIPYFFLHFRIRLLLVFGAHNVMHLLARIGDFLRSNDPLEDVINDVSDFESSLLVLLFP